NIAHGGSDLSGDGRKRQSDAEGTAGSQSALGGDLSTQLLNEAGGDGQTKSRAGAVTRSIRSVEALEDVGKILGGYTDPVVLHLQHSLSGLPMQRHAHPGGVTRRRICVAVSGRHLSILDRIV